MRISEVGSTAVTLALGTRNNVQCQLYEKCANYGELKIFYNVILKFGGALWVNLQIKIWPKF